MALDLTRDIVLRWDKPEPSHIPLFRKAGVTAILPSTAEPPFVEACSRAGIAVIAPSEIQFLQHSELGSAKPGGSVALTNGLWPGIGKPANVQGRGDETASASIEPWVDSNGYWIGYLRALYPDRPPVLGYLPDKLGDRAVPFDSLELALVEAWTAGGNYILALEPHYRAALLQNEPKAIAAWEQLGRTTRWLREHIALFRQPALPIVTSLVDSGAASAEISNLLYRRHVSPALYPVSAPPVPDVRARLALVAANLRQPEPESAKRILAHAEAGTTVITASLPSQQWWRSPALKPIRSEADREFFSVGKGQLVAYRRPIADPSEFALDVIDLINHKNRAVRLWNALAVIALVTKSPRSGERLLHVINYGSPIDVEVQARVQGHFTKAMLMRPDASPVPLQAAKRGTTTEVFLPEIKRVAVVAAFSN
jgi:hypothetical protein